MTQGGQKRGVLRGLTRETGGGPDTGHWCRIDIDVGFDDGTEFIRTVWTRRSDDGDRAWVLHDWRLLTACLGKVCHVRFKPDDEFMLFDERVVILDAGPLARTASTG
jgi:hypothetical protein